MAAATAANGSALPGLLPPEDEVLEFEFPAVTEAPDVNYEFPDTIPALNYIGNLQIIGRDAGVGGSDGEYQSHTIGDDDEEDSKSSSYLRPHGRTLTGFSRRYGLGGRLSSRLSI